MNKYIKNSLYEINSKNSITIGDYLLLMGLEWSVVEILSFNFNYFQTKIYPLLMFISWITPPGKIDIW